MPVHHGSGSEIFYVGDEFFRALWRYRAELAPVYWLLGCLLAGWWLHASHPSWWPLPIVAGLIGLVLLTFRPAALITRYPLLSRWRVRIWGTGFITTVSAWLAAATIAGPTAGPMRLIALLATAVFAVPWIWREDRARLTKVRILRDRFPNTADAAGLTGATMVSAVIDRWGWTARIKLRRGQHWTDAVNAIPKLESAFGSRIGSLRAEPVNDDAAAFTLRMIEIDPHAEPIEWTPTPAKRATSIRRPLTIGVFEDGTEINVSFLRKHAMIGGATDSGKSGVLNVIIARIAECNDTALWGIDLKEGMELSPWSKVLSRPVATNSDAAETLLSAAIDELERRAQFLTSSGQREWTPEPDAPALYVIIDEYAELSKRAQKLADSISRRGRALCINLVIATQRPTQKSMGEGSALRSQMNIRICLRVNERPDVDLILGAGKLASGWDTTKFDAPGKYLISAPGLDTPRRGRAHRMTDTDVQATASQHARQPDTHADTAPAGSPQSRSDGPEEGRATAGTPRGISGPEMALWAALRNAPPEGVTIADLRTATGLSRTGLYRRLSTLRTGQQATQVRHGRWRSTQPDRTGTGAPPPAEGDSQ
ncbi:FtsK/SpoIIIE domain-containing protein [Kribbella solani]|uniref:FtsK/SpoIIIE domain-containing protein n=1 Tax=Kribbella solani TaxID=236067 RepID=UPI0029B989DB|nr:FtsK/SpoIIIE domain-containing protein [Kribbella solani]MDX2974487.1 FtsK/SpoIIIE domain-containing protein [Kribbella solani]